MYKIKVPATTANLGAGFDCFGLALCLYNTIELKTASAGLSIEIDDGIITQQNTLGKFWSKLPK